MLPSAPKKNYFAALTSIRKDIKEEHQQPQTARPSLSKETINLFKEKKMLLDERKFTKPLGD